MKANVPKVSLLVSILVVAAGGLGWRLARARPAVSQGAPSEDSKADELAALRQQVRALQDDQSRTRYKVDVALNAKESAAQDPASAKADDEPTTPEELAKRDYERSKHVADYVQRAMDGETIDLTWAPTRIQEIRESFKRLELPGFSFKDAECRASLCRTTIARAPEGVTQELGTAIMQLEPFKHMGAFFHYEDDRVVLYSPREGHDFPKDPALARR